jgi:hypothetical protein
MTDFDPLELPPGERAHLAKWEVEWAEHSTARLRRLRELSGGQAGHWGDESEELADLLAAFRDPDAMKPVRWW